ncbi:MAG: D-cysteine desulfhydrase family protein, partial [Thermomicrobiales bacterium]|nr:D-cysteine desulfhydrase family protein [Thermomicrobiales bacterium]
MQLATLPRFRLTQLPTPVQRLRGLEAALGPATPRIYIKRDDLTGLALGGNKARKLEYLVADALAAGADVLVTEGAVQSNHCRITAAAARVAGLRCVLVVDATNGAAVAGNLLLDHLLDAEVRIAPDRAARAELMATIGDELRANGETPYLIPTGGSVPLGAASYVAAVAETLEQLREIGEAPRSLYVASGSQGTQAGLMVGARAFSAPFSVEGVAVLHPVEDLAGRCQQLANETAELLGLQARFTRDDVRLDGAFVGQAYGVPTPEGLEALRLLARTEAIFLDP